MLEIVDFDKSPKPAAANNPSVREGEPQKSWFRGDRFFSVQNSWFFSTRENKNVGPYPDRHHAEHGLKLFIDAFKNQKADFQHAVAIATVSDDWAISSYR